MSFCWMECLRERGTASTSISYLPASGICLEAEKKRRGPLYETVNTRYGRLVPCRDICEFETQNLMVRSCSCGTPTKAAVIAFAPIGYDSVFGIFDLSLVGITFRHYPISPKPTTPPASATRSRFRSARSSNATAFSSPISRHRPRNRPSDANQPFTWHFAQLPFDSKAIPPGL
jgi:hypothetical protein